MTFIDSVRTCMGNKYLFRFRGRASRSEFWWFMLFILIVNIVTGAICSFLPQMVGASLALAVSLALFPANLGVTVRRMHDRNLRGWWLLLPIFALAVWGVGGGSQMPNPVSSVISLSMCLCYLAILCLPGQPGVNRFGPNPLEYSDGNI